MANRWASSRMRCSRNSPCESRGSMIESFRPGRNISSCCLARDATGTRPVSSNSSSTFTASASCPLPPSTISKSGSMEKDGSFFPPMLPSPAPSSAKTAGEAPRAWRRNHWVRPAAAHLEAAVVRLVRHALFEHDHAGHHRGSLDVGDIITLHPRGRRRKAQFALQFGKRLHLPGVVRLPLRPQRPQRLARVLRRHLHQFPVHPAWGTESSHFFPAAPRAQPLLDDPRFLHFGGQQHFRGM